MNIKVIVIIFCKIDIKKCLILNLQGCKLEDDKQECIFQCKTKPTCKTTPTSTPIKYPHGIGYRINYYPWFVPYSS